VIEFFIIKTSLPSFRSLILGHPETSTFQTFKDEPVYGTRNEVVHAYNRSWDPDLQRIFVAT